MSELARRVKAAGRREHPADVQKTLDRLRGAADARADLKGVVDVAVAAVEAARLEADEARVRAELAEETLAAVRPHMEELVERTESAERDVAARSAIDAAADERERQEKRAVAKAEQHERDWAITPRAQRLMGQVVEQVEHLRAAQDAQAAGVVAKAAQLITVIHKAVKNEDGKSPVQVFREAGHVWTVRDCDEGVIAETDSRREAIQLVADLLAEELAETEKQAAAEWTEEERYRPHVRDEVHPATPWRDRKKQPADIEQPPAPPGEIAPGVSKRKKQARIL